MYNHKFKLKVGSQFIWNNMFYELIDLYISDKEVYVIVRNINRAGSYVTYSASDILLAIRQNNIEQIE